MVKKNFQSPNSAELVQIYEEMFFDQCYKCSTPVNYDSGVIKTSNFYSLKLTITDWSPVYLQTCSYYFCIVMPFVFW